MNHVADTSRGTKSLFETDEILFGEVMLDMCVPARQGAPRNPLALVLAEPRREVGPEGERLQQLDREVQTDDSERGPLARVIS